MEEIPQELMAEHHDHDCHDPEQAARLGFFQTFRVLGKLCSKGLIKNQRAPHAHDEKIDKDSIVSQRYSKLAPITSLISGLGQTGVSALGNSSAMFVQGMHDVLDAGALKLQSHNASDKSCDKTHAEKMRTANIARWASFGVGSVVLVESSAAIISGLAGYKFGEINKHYVEHAQVQMYMAVGGLATNATLMVQPIKRAFNNLREGKILTHHDHELLDHLGQDIVGSTVVFGSALASEHNLPYLSAGFGALLSGMMVWRFAPYPIATATENSYKKLKSMF